MKRSLNTDCKKLVGKEVLIKGWVYNIREHGKIVFADIRDRSGLIQVVDETGGLSGVKPEYVVEIEGKVKNRGERYINNKIETGKIEIEAKEVRVIETSRDLPFEINKPKLDVSLPVMLDYRNASYGI